MLCLALVSEWKSVIITDFFFVTHLVLGIALSVFVVNVLYQELLLEDPPILACWGIMVPLLIQ